MGCGRVSVTAISLELQTETAPRSFSTSLPSSRDRGRGPFKWQRSSQRLALCTRRAGWRQQPTPLAGSRRGLARQRQPPARDSQPSGRLEIVEWSLIVGDGA